jgi:hypothetical protein
MLLDLWLIQKPLSGIQALMWIIQNTAIKNFDTIVNNSDTIRNLSETSVIFSDVVASSSEKIVKKIEALS